MKTFIRSVKEINNSNIIMYTTEDGLTKIEVTFDGDTVWLSLDQMAKLFQRDKSTISRHIKNIFSEGELYLKIYVYGLKVNSGRKQLLQNLQQFKRKEIEVCPEILNIIIWM